MTHRKYPQKRKFTSDSHSLTSYYYYYFFFLSLITFCSDFHTLGGSSPNRGRGGSQKRGSGGRGNRHFDLIEDSIGTSISRIKT